ncbi:MAG: biotin--[acetyl-CoA-carboxylase] ligase [Bacteroidales bacterium]
MKGLTIGSKVISLLSIESTNDYARKLLTNGTPEDGTVIIAGEQHKGRGHGKNGWYSQRGKNLTFTIILYPYFISADNQFLLSKAISLGINDYLSQYLDDIYIKWPNDIYVDNYKIAGILIENDWIGARMKNSVIGIGLNINQQYFPDHLPNPVSLMQVMEHSFSLKTEFRKLLYCLDYRYKMIKNKYVDTVNKDYHNKLYRLNEYHTYTAEDEEFVARIIGVTDHGKLILESEHGKTMEFDFKEVEFLL